MTALPAEWLTTIALKPGMHVHDGSRRAPEHVVAAVTPTGGAWDVTFADTDERAVVGSRHAWLVEPT